MTEKNVSGADACTARQAMRAGLVDELALYLVPVLLGRGIRLFEAMGEVPLTLEPTRGRRRRGRDTPLVPVLPVSP